MMMAFAALLGSATLAWTPPLVPSLVEGAGIKQHYLVRDGQLLVRTAADTDWRALAPPPEAVKPIIAVSADEDDFYVVVTSDGLLHAHFPCPPDDSACQPFMTRWGLPFLEHRQRPLGLPFAVDHLRAGRVAFSVRHKTVAQYEEPGGRAVNWGRAGTSSLFVLDDTGTRIFLADPWLPPDFSREVPPPTHNSEPLVLASIAASASQLMAITVDGRVFTRFYDYDVNGGTPFFFYDHRLPLDDAFANEPPTSLASEAMTRLVPAEPWREQAPIGGRVSRRIAIVQTGVGNLTRRMSVVGELDGQRGVFQKSIADLAWRFVGADEAVSAEEWLTAPTTTTPTTLPSPKLSMGGWWRMESVHDRRQVHASTNDFWFHNEVAHITLHTGEGDVELTVQLADAWTLFAADNAADNDTAWRLLMATVTATTASSTTSTTSTTSTAASAAEATAIVRRQLGSVVADRLDRTFAFVVIANQHELVLVPAGHPFVMGPETNELVMTTDPARRARRHSVTTPYSRLIQRRGASLSSCDPALLVAVEDLHEEAAVKALRSLQLSMVAPPLTVVADAAFLVSTARFWLPHARYLQGFEQHLPAIITAQRLATQRWLDASDADYRHVRNALITCRR